MIDLATTPPVLSFFAAGVPAPGGSKKSFVSASTGKMVVLDTCKRNKPWRQVVAGAARETLVVEGLRFPLTAPLGVSFAFTFPRPRLHHGRGRLACRVKLSAPSYPAVRPDLTKIVRSTEDALTSIVWKDDSQIVRQWASKDYGPVPGVRVTVWTLTP